MNILLSNDDGYDSPGILGLHKALKNRGHQVTLVAPHRERSAVGHSLTLHKPLRILEIEPDIFAVTGSPADCVYLATRKILDTKPDLMISGINRGANLGQDIFYSGTVAAAREGHLYGLPALAASLCVGKPNKHAGNPYWETAFEFVLHFADQVRPSLPGHWLLNANIPDLPKSQVQGVKWTRQGRRIYSNEIVENHDPRGKPYYWIGGGAIGHEDSPLSDCENLMQGFITLTALKVDTTDEAQTLNFQTQSAIHWK